VGGLGINSRHDCGTSVRGESRVIWLVLSRGPLGLGSRLVSSRRRPLLSEAALVEQGRGWERLQAQHEYSRDSEREDVKYLCIDLDYLGGGSRAVAQIKVRLLTSRRSGALPNYLLHSQQNPTLKHVCSASRHLHRVVGEVHSLHAAGSVARIKLRIEFHWLGGRASRADE
jgi:hypothetical protein